MALPAQGLFCCAVSRVFWLQPPLPRVSHTHTQAQSNRHFVTIFHPFSIPHTGRTARKNNINQRARLLQIIQAILFHVDVWYNAPFQFSVHFLCRFVTWPTTGQSCTPFGVDRRLSGAWEGAFYIAHFKTVHCTSGLTCWGTVMHVCGQGAVEFLCRR